MAPSQEALDLISEAHLVDLHVVTEIPVRLWGYDPLARHPTWRSPLFGHADLPRLGEAGYTGVVWDITTNPVRPRRARQAVTLRNLERARALVRAGGALVTDLAGYHRAREEGRLACWLSLQGGNALVHDPSVLEGEVGRLLHRITLVHMTRSALGGAQTLLGGDRGLTAAGREFIAGCNRARILVDLAHASPSTFWGALEAHAPDLPPIVSHTGCSALHASWRGIDDDQIRAIAQRGGVVGIVFHSAYLEPRLLGGRRAAILDHVEHVLAVAGEGSAALGSDFDGFIVPPADLADVTGIGDLVQDMLERRWTEARIRGVLGESYLRVVGEVRPGRAD